MFWADKILQNREGLEWINDAWTPSGIVHMGGLKGPIIHDVLFKILNEQRKEVKYTFGFDDMDAIDGLPENLKEKLGAYMGIPVAYAPSPDGNGTFGEFYAQKMRIAFKALNIDAEIYLASEYYKKGVYDDAIRFVLDHRDEIRKVYEEMYSKQIPDAWYPLQVVCPNCGKVGTTTVTGWDGVEVTFECMPNKVAWAQGCEHRGKISPFGGNATMPFKVEWAAKWWVFKVTIEGAGKDHASSGGTYDVARKIVKDVFAQEPPLWLPYEFFLYDGKKMSSSKGLGLTAEELMEVLPPELIRFLMIKTEPNTAVEFNPFGTQIIPKLFEDYQRAAQEFEKDPESDLGRVFKFSQIGEIEMPSQFRFLTLTQWVQMPNMEDKIKEEGLEDWARYAKVWIERFAPEKDKFIVQEKLPDISSLGQEQKDYLGSLVNLFEKDIAAEELQTAIYDKAKEKGISSIDSFKAIYTAFLGKDHGPKAAWLLHSLDREFVKDRLQVATSK